MADSAEAWHGEDWKGSKEDRAVAGFAEGERIDLQPETMMAVDSDLALQRMFEQRPIQTLSNTSGKYLTSSHLMLGTSFGPPSPKNILRSVVLTALAMISRSRVRGRFLTSGGTSEQKNRAKEATSWLDGWTSENDVHALAGLALRDGLISRFGVLQLYEADNKVCLQKILPEEISFDYASARYGMPKTIHRKRGVPKGVLRARFTSAKQLAAIDAAKVLESDDGTTSDLVLVREAYSTPSAPGAKDGWHIVAIEGADGGMLAKPYEKPWQPFVFFMWDKFLTGLGGNSLAAQLETMQVELNYSLLVERKAMKLMAVPRIGVKRGSKIIKEQLTNGIGTVIEYTDTPPVPLVWPALPPEFYKAQATLIEAMFEVTGISQYASQGVAAVGPDASGAAQREATETQGVRLQVYSQHSWETPIVELFNKAVEMAADIVGDGHSYETLAPGPKGLDKVDFAKTVKDLKEKKIVCYPSGFLPLQPSARLAFIKEMIDSKMWDVERAKLALQDLDVESEQTLENSLQALFNKTFEAMLYEGKPKRPTELTVGHAEQVFSTAALYMALGELEDVSPKNMSIAQRYLDELTELVKAKNASSAPPPAPSAPVPTPAQAQPLGGAPVAPSIAG